MSISKENPVSHAAPSPFNSNAEIGGGDTAEHSLRDDRPDSEKWETQAPDGGLAAWLALLGSWCMLFCTFGLINCIHKSLS
jgi:hypothetical protein